jgi:ABC-type uncharacterized transport system substrate-binding protein
MNYSSILIPVCLGNDTQVSYIIAIESVRKISRNGNRIDIHTWDGFFYNASDRESRLFETLVKHLNERNLKL